MQVTKLLAIAKKANILNVNEIVFKKLIYAYTNI